MYTQFMLYFQKEKIYTGYDIEVGWIHTIAHSADVIDEFVQISWFKEPELTQLFKAISKKMKQPNHVFNFNEDERMARALAHGINRHILSKTYIKAWMDSCIPLKDTDNILSTIYLKKNTKQLLRSLYFLLLDDTQYEELTNYIKTTLISAL